MPDPTIYYKRARFLTHLPVNRLYTRSHCWLLDTGAGVWRIGLTKFSSRMLGDMVEFGFGVKSEDSVAVGQVIGWIEGFKAVSDLYSVASGRFSGSNPALDGDITLIDSKPYGEGWLYEVNGTADPEAIDVHGYIALLDATIDKMLAGRHDEGKSV
jgi:glycine cleavage system H protein